ncbi:MAG: PKD domain-containing protein [Actinomycetota bacterium]|nr:PKD domain-containing protein [Actinomycetota bacterium]
MLGLLLTPAAAPATGGVTFTASQNGARTMSLSGTSPIATDYAWTFGDGTSSTDLSATQTHTYPAAGNYDVTLATSDGSDTLLSMHVYDTPSADFTWSGGPTVSFSDASAGEPTAWHWDFGDGSQSSARNPTHTFAVGNSSVTLTVSNPAGSSPATTHIVTVDPPPPPPPPNQPPTAEFAIVSTPAPRGGIVSFDASLSTDPDPNTLLSYAWDLDGNGTYTDATGPTASRMFATAGTFTVGLKVSDGSLSDKQFHTVTVIDDRPPAASFSFAPAAPVVGTSVAFTSASSDPDGQIAALAWDLNGDGRFDDAQGPTAAWTFDAPGAHTVSLRATDDRGVSAIAFQTVEVSAAAGVTPAVQPAPGSAPVGPPPSSRAPSPGLMSPFPVVRIRGIIIGGRVRIGVLSVKAPKGATVRIHCRGGSCAVHWVSHRVLSAAHSVRFRRLERSVRAGTVIEVFVRSTKAIGKYTRFDIRAGKAPLRRDGCLSPGSMRPTRCPLQ